MMSNLLIQTPADCLIVAADFEPPDQESWIEEDSWEGERLICAANRNWIFKKVRNLAKNLAGTGVYLKVNSALRACGHHLVESIHEQGLRVFADLKLCDIPATLRTDGRLLRRVKPDLLTVMCATGDSSIGVLKNELPETELLGVTMLTSLDERYAMGVHQRPIADMVQMLALYGSHAGVDGFVASAHEARLIREAVPDPRFTINTPAIRPVWATVVGDDQNLTRVMTPAQAIQAGANRIVVGRPIIRAKNPREAVERTLAEIEQALDVSAV